MQDFPKFYIFIVLSIFLNNALLQVTSKSKNYAFVNRYQQTFLTYMG